MLAPQLIGGMTSDSRSNFDVATDGLAEYINEVAFTDLPDEVVELEKRHLLDTLGCILYGPTTPWVRKVIDGLKTSGETGSATVLGDGSQFAPARAALVNGMASHSMDFDDTCRPGVHAGSASVPSALAHVETADRSVSGKEFLTAFVAGVEVGIRSGFGLGRHSAERGLHIAGFTGPFSAAATTGKLLNLDKTSIGHGLAIAGTQGSGLMGAQYGAEVKRYHMGRAAESGYLGAIFANETLTGDQRIFGDRYGSIGPSLSGEGHYDRDAVIDSLGDEYELLDSVNLKPFPSIISVHAPVAAVRKLLEEERFDPDTVESVTVWTSQVTKDHVGWDYEPEGVMAAQGNIQYGIASLLEDGELSIDAYTEEAIRRQRVLERTNDIEIQAAEEFNEDESWGARVRVKTQDGKSYTTTVRDPPGSPTNRMDEDEIIAKFRNQAEKVLPDESVDSIVDFVFSIEEKNDVTEIFDYLE